MGRLAGHCFLGLDVYHGLVYEFGFDYKMYELGYSTWH